MEAGVVGVPGDLDELTVGGDVRVLAAHEEAARLGLGARHGLSGGALADFVACRHLYEWRC